MRIIKRLFLLILILTLIFVTIILGSVHIGAAEISAEGQLSAKGVNYTIDLYVEDIPSDSSGFVFDVTYNSQHLTFSETNDNLTNLKVFSNDDDSGNLKILAYSNQSLQFSDKSKLFTLKFKVLSPESGSITLTMTDAVDSKGIPIDAPKTLNLSYDFANPKISVNSSTSNKGSFSIGGSGADKKPNDETSDESDSDKDKDGYTEYNAEERLSQITLLVVSMIITAILILIIAVVRFVVLKNTDKETKGKFKCKKNESKTDIK